MIRSKLLHILDLIDQAIDDNPHTLEEVSHIKDAKIRARVERLVHRLSDDCIGRKFVEGNVTRLNEQVLEYAQNNYYCEVPLTERNDTVDSLIMSMNMLGEEINYSTVSRVYFTDIYNTIPDFVLVVDDMGVIKNANQAFLSTFNIDEAILFNQYAICDFIKDECDYQHLVTSVKDGDNYRFLQVEGNGDIPITIKMGDFTESNNGKVCRVFILRDFTEVMHYQKDLELALDKAQESDRLKTAFLDNMSHEIRTPMNGILGFADLLRNKNLTDDRREQFIGLIHESGNRMLNTVNDIIEISKIQADQLSIVVSEFKLVDELNSLMRIYGAEAEKKGLVLSLNNYIDDEVSIRTDKSKLVSILANLIRNAIKFTHKGTVTLECRKVNESLLCSVIDTGVGIPKDREHAIFDSFVQADIEDVNAYQGSGLGLTITKAHIDILGGDISVDSQLGKGSHFSFHIPWIEDDTTYVRVKGFDFEEENAPEWTILVAEDDVINYQYLKNLLEHKCKEILWAKTGVESLNLVKTHRDIDFVLMDIRMPGMDGYEATKRIKKLRPELPVVAQTAYALPEDKAKALRSGCDGFLAKPLDINKLKLILKDL